MKQANFTGKTGMGNGMGIDLIDPPRGSHPATWILGLAALIATLVYLPGLSGSFTFDDSGVLLQNKAIQLDNPGFMDWVAAAASFGGDGINSRWLGMLTFAVNHSLTGMDPYWFKVTNLVIHLINGLLLFLTLRSLFELHALREPGSMAVRSFDGGLVAAAIAALWLVLPINLTCVLYASQRLESLSHTLVFLGLWWYLQARISSWKGRGGTRGMWLSLVVCTTVGIQIKESAVLLPVYAFCIELVLTRGRNGDRRWNRSVPILFGVLLALPLLLGLIWLGGRSLQPHNFGRDFDIPQRLMTEGRVMFDYMVWTLAPNLDSLTLYHDDVVLSKGLLSPPSTLLAAMGITGLLGVAIWQRARRPLLALGIFWFFGGHLLTGTIIPLLLVFEHRNYFPSVGLLLAVTSLVALEGPAIKVRAIAFAAASLFAFYAFTTLLRSLEWSSPLQLAASDAAKRPDSSASQYEYARTLLNSTLDGDPKPMQAKAFAILERMAANPDAEATHNQLLIVYSTDLKRPINPEWWESMIAKLSARPPTSTEATALVALLKCFDAKFCARDVDHLHRAFAAATSHSGGYATMYSAYGRFAQHYLEDAELAERQFREAVNQAPRDPETLVSLAGFLIQSGKLDEAEFVVGQLTGINRFGLLDKRLAKVAQDLAQARRLQ